MNVKCEVCIKACQKEKYYFDNNTFKLKTHLFIYVKSVDWFKSFSTPGISNEEQYPKVTLQIC